MRQTAQIPLMTDRHAAWLVKLFFEQPYQPQHYAQPNRRDYYKIVLVTGGSALLLVGAMQYKITAPALICLHPRDMISWKVQDEDLTAYAMYIRQEALRHVSVKTMIGQCGLFDNASCKVAQLSSANDTTVLSAYFSKMQSIVQQNDFAFDFLVGYLQLFFAEVRQRCFVTAPGMPAPFPAQVRQFFELLEHETAQLSTATPLTLKTAREYATQLAVHPNYLNAILKKHTGQNVSTHIRTRLVEEAKSLLVQTDWTIKEISYLVGFSDPPNFSIFFKSNTGQTPADFRNRSLVV